MKSFLLRSLIFLKHPIQTLQQETYTHTHIQYTHICVYVCVFSYFSHVQLFETPATVVPQSPLTMGFSRQAYWSGLPFPFPGNLPDPGIEPGPPASPALQVHS